MTLVLLGVLALIGVGAAIGLGQLNRRTDSVDEPPGQGIRRFFQYVLLFGMFLAASAGVAGLLGLLLSGERDPAELAQSLTFVLVALPILVGLAWWTRHQLLADPGEARSAALSRYLTFASLSALVMAITAAHRVLASVLGGRSLEPLNPAVASLVVWGGGWALHRWLGRRLLAEGPPRAEQVLGAAIGLGVGAAGAVSLLGTSLRALFGRADSLVLLVAPMIARAAALFLVGLMVGAVYWWRELRRASRDAGWLALVLLLGAGGGLALALVGTSLLGYTVLVWLIGDPAGASAAHHFWSAPLQLAAALVGGLVWWYHRQILAETELAGSPPIGAPAGRTEVERLYDYLLAGIALIAAAAGLMLIVTTLVEAATAQSVTAGRGSAVNTLLAAVSLLAVGLPAWWWRWGSARRARATDLAGEVTSPTRRAYLLLLFGVAGVTAVIALLVAVNTLLRALFTGELGALAWLDVRWSLGVLVAASLVCALHWGPFRADRSALEELRAAAAVPEETVGTPVAGLAPAPRQRRVTLVGPEDPELVRHVTRIPGTTVSVLTRRDAQALRWDQAQVVRALVAQPDGDLLVLAGPGEAVVIPVATGAGEGLAARPSG